MESSITWKLKHIKINRTVIVGMSYLLCCGVLHIYTFVCRIVDKSQYLVLSTSVSKDSACVQLCIN